VATVRSRELNHAICLFFGVPKTYRRARGLANQSGCASESNAADGLCSDAY
jgi:hypothetical protein